MISGQKVSAAPAVKEWTPSEVASMTDALAQLRTKRSESSSEPKAPTLRQLEAEAAPFEVEEVVPIEPKSGSAGKFWRFLIV